MATKKGSAGTGSSNAAANAASDSANTAEPASVALKVGDAEQKSGPARSGTADDKPKKLKSSKADYMFGHMTTKIFQLTEAQLKELGRSNRDTTILSAVALGALSLAVDVTKDLMLASDAPVQTVAFFAGVAAVSWLVSIGAGLYAIFKWIERDSLVQTIRKQTDFKGQDGE
jgi:hypothetical protein